MFRPIPDKSSRYTVAAGDVPVPTVTAAADRFISEHFRLLTAHLSVMQLQNNAMDDVIPKFGGENEDERKAANEFVEEVRVSESVFFELILTRTVDNYLCFITDLLALIYLARPHMLRSSEEQETLDFILAHTSMDELVAAIAEKRVERLSYLGLKKLAKYVQKQMKFDLFLSEIDCQEAALAVEMRNICVHARGLVGSAAAKRFPSELGPLKGQRLPLDRNTVKRARHMLENSVADIDLRATAKFGLKTRDF